MRDEAVEQDFGGCFADLDVRAGGEGGEGGGFYGVFGEARGGEGRGRVDFGEGADLAEAVGYAADGEDGEDAWWRIRCANCVGKRGHT